MDMRHTSVGFVSTYPPTVCGLASYTASLVRAIGRERRSRAGLGVVDVGDNWREPASADVVFHHRIGHTPSLEQAIRVLNRYDCVSIQHEFGIFGGSDGAEVVDLIDGIEVPVAVTFHTVLDRPSPNQRAIVGDLAERAGTLIVMSNTASDRLQYRYGIDPDRVTVIPHGTDALFTGPSLVAGDRPLILTWGLIGPGKGLESAIEAFANLTDLVPRPRYLIAGATHPHVREAAGESYREGLMALVDRLGLSDIVEFDDQYLDRTSLARLARSADLVLLPYESVEQVTSGVLVEAIAASKPVVATQFPHAIELLSAGAGVTVPHGDTAAISTEIRRLLTDRVTAAVMARHARRLADGWAWPTIAARFDSTLSRLVASRRVNSSSAVREVQRAAG